MATLQEKIETEHRMREFLRAQEFPEPDAVEYGFTCIRLFFEQSRTCVVIDIDEEPEDDDDVDQ